MNIIDKVYDTGYDGQGFAVWLDFHIPFAPTEAE